MATTIAKEPGKGIHAARLKGFTEDVAGVFHWFNVPQIWNRTTPFFAFPGADSDEISFFDSGEVDLSGTALLSLSYQAVQRGRQADGWRVGAFMVGTQASSSSPIEYEAIRPGYLLWFGFLP
jgi:hypothetical protein